MDEISDAPVRPGDVLAGKYRVERVLGAGGMGVVVSAHHIHLNERVALKFLLPHVATSQVVVARFLREAQAAVRIKSEHVARVTDVGTLESGSPYMVMEYLSGSDLSAVVGQRGPLPAADAVDYVLQACEAIAEAHAAGIVHRDLKPSNMFVTQRADGSELVKLLDFGISKAAVDPASQQQSLTATAAVMGSPLYMSPEQITNAKDVDARADVWSLGVVLHELVTGTYPFSGETVPGLIVSIATKAPIPLRLARPDAPPELERVILHCLEKDRSLRFQSVAELADALAPLAHERSRISIERITRTLRATSRQRAAVPAALEATLPMGNAQVPQPHTANAWVDSGAPARTRRSPIALGVAGLVALVALGVGSAFALSSKRHGAATDAPAISSASSHVVVQEASTTTAPPEPPAASVSAVSAPSASAPSAPPAATHATPTHHAGRPAPQQRSAPAPSATATSTSTGIGSLIDDRK